MGKTFWRGASSALVGCVGLAAFACGDTRSEPAGDSASALYGGTAVPDASQVGIVWLEHLANQNDTLGCWLGTGVLVANDVILTAGHVADYTLAKQACSKQGLTPKFLRITMPDATGVQQRLVSCGDSSIPDPKKKKEGCGAKFHTGYVSPVGPDDHWMTNNRGEDVAAIMNFGTLPVNGIGSFYERATSRKPTSSFYGKKVTCYGMSSSKPLGGGGTIGQLRMADFTVLEYPHPNAVLPQFRSLFATGTMFAVSRGGDITPTPTELEPDGGGYAAIPVGGDSGGPCIEHTNGVAGDIVGIYKEGDPKKLFGDAGPPAPEFGHYSAAPGFRNWLRCRLHKRVSLVPCDLDGDGQADDAIGIRRSALDTLQLAATFNDGAQQFVLDTPFPAASAEVGCMFPGDFDGDGDADIVSTIGGVLAALPLYFNGASASSFSSSFTLTSNPAAWTPNGPYEYYTVGRFDGDSIDDAAAVRFDGSEDVFLGKAGVGLTVPAQFVPRGFNWYGPGDEEAFAISAPGIVEGVSCKSNGETCTLDSECCGGGTCKVLPDAGADAGADGGTDAGAEKTCQDGTGIQAVIGKVYFAADNLANTLWDGLEVQDLSLDFLASGSATPFGYKSSFGDLFGSALAWGSFDGDPDRHDLVIGAPGVKVAGLPNAGILAVLRYDPSSTTVFRAAALARDALSGSPAANARFGQDLAVGDFNGDGRDDLATRTGTDVQILYGAAGVGLQATGTEPIFTSADLGIASPPSINGGLTTGDFNCDGFEDLAVGDPLESLSTSTPDGGTPDGATPDGGTSDGGGADAGTLGGTGAVVILYGSAAGLDKKLRQRIDLSLLGNPASTGQFGGGELAAGNFNGDSYSGRPCVDLAVPTAQGSGSVSNGAVYVLYGSSEGLRAAGSQHLVQGGAAADGTTIDDTSEPGDGFGQFLAITRADLDRYDDLIIGAFNEDLTKGAAHVLRGGPNGITAAGQALWRQGSPAVIPDQGENGPNPNPLSLGDRFGWSVGGTSNGVIVVGASWEDLAPTPGAPELPQTGWAAVIRVKDSSTLGIGNGLDIEKVLEASESKLMGNANALRRDAFFGGVITKARPAFVPRTNAPPRYAGKLVLAGGTRFDCLPDTTPPVLGSVTIAPECLWPPNGKLVAYELGSNIQYQVTDACDPQPKVRIAGITSNESASGAPAFGFDGDSACVRSERLGTGSGRIYTITLEARDSSGNTSSTNVNVTVPKASTPGCAVAPSAFAKQGDPRCAF